MCLKQVRYRRKCRAERKGAQVDRVSLLATGQRDCGQWGMETQGGDEHHRAKARAAMSEKESPFPVMAVFPYTQAVLTRDTYVPTKHFDFFVQCLFPDFKQSKLYYLKLMKKGILGIPGRPMFHSHFKEKPNQIHVHASLFSRIVLVSR